MASITLTSVAKIYPDGTKAVSDLDLKIGDGDFMVLVGPSGCGKTTALRMVAGLEEITHGTVSIGDAVINDLDPGKRDIAMVFQNYALYPHMSVFDNMAFPLRSQRVPRRERQRRVEKAAAILGLSELLAKRPSALSGGQRQRVAMGRAIVREPQAFLMDEPLSNLDAKLRVQMRSEISGIQTELGVTTIYVTHDQVEAMTMGTRIAVMRKGILEQEGPPETIYNLPATLFVAAFIGSPGMNFVRTKIQRAENGTLIADVEGQPLSLGSDDAHGRRALAEYVDHDVAVGIRPENLLVENTPNCSTLRATVERSEMLGAERLLHVSLGARPVVTEQMIEAAETVDTTTVSSLKEEESQRRVTLIARIAPSVTPPIHSSIDLHVQGSDLHFFDLKSGSRIC
jgi:multiple sugar transport system ATP-binding protein